MQIIAIFSVKTLLTLLTLTILKPGSSRCQKGGIYISDIYPFDTAPLERVILVSKYFLHHERKNHV